MRRKISDEQIKIESEAGFKPLTIESGIALLPFSELGDREFELLSYLLVQEEINNSKYANINSISLMQGVSERGRDCILYNQGKVVGLIQCKKYTGRLTKPQALKEIIKFLLFATLDKSILPDPDNFEYKLYVSNDLTEPAITLIKEYSIKISDEIENGVVDQYIKEIANEYESFSTYKENTPSEAIKSRLKKIKVSYSNATDLSARTYSQDKLLSLFFNVKTIVDLEGADHLIRNALDDYGLKYLTDDDLKKLQDRIGNTKEENRINLGFVDFFGYNKEFFKFLKGEPFNKVIQSVASVNSLLDKYLLDFINSKIHELVLLYITEDLLNKGKIHTFSVGVAAPYLLKRLSITLLAKSMPETLLSKYYPQFSMTKEELVSEIAETLYESSERVMAKDYSQLAGSPEDIEFKIRIFAHMHKGLSSIEDAKLVFSKDMKVIQPVLDRIENQVNELLQEERTVVIKDSSFFDDEDQMKALAATIKAID
jgi:hypothetical protein